jgi:hypothetical protein
MTKKLAYEPKAKVGDRITGRCVTMGTVHTGTVVDVIGPIQTDYRYKIRTNETYAGSERLMEPIVYYGQHAED